MDHASGNGPELWGIKEVSARTGLPASTIRYYDQQFSEYMGVRRGPGRRRLFDQGAVDRLMTVQRMLKDQGLSLRQARQALAGDGQGPAEVEGLDACRRDMAGLREELTALRAQVAELKDIQRRTLALIDSLTGS